MKKKRFVVGASLLAILCVLTPHGIREARGESEKEKDVAALKARIELLEEANAKNKDEINRLVKENKKRLRGAPASRKGQDEGFVEAPDGLTASEQFLQDLERGKTPEPKRAASIRPDRAIDSDSYRAANEMYMRGSAAYKKGNLAAARKEFESALGLNPELLAARAQLADCLSDMKEYDASIEQHKILAERLPYGVEPYVDMADIYVARNDTVSALKVLNEAAALIPDAEIIHERMGLIYYKKKQYDSAKEEFTSELRINSSSAESRKYLKKIARMEKEALRREREEKRKAKR